MNNMNSKIIEITNTKIDEIIIRPNEDTTPVTVFYSMLDSDGNYVSSNLIKIDKTDLQTDFTSEILNKINEQEFSVDVPPSL